MKFEKSLNGVTTFLIKVLIRFYKVVFAKRTILFVTNKKIRTINIGAFAQIVVIIAMFFIGHIFLQSARYDSLIDAKSDQINHLQSANKYFQGEVEELNEKIAKITEYVNSVTGNKHDVKAQEFKFKQPKNFREEDLSEKDSHTFKQIKDANQKLANIQVMAQNRIKKIENIILITGLNLKRMPQKILHDKSSEMVREISLNDSKNLKKGQGGPRMEVSSLEELMNAKTAEQEDLESHLEKLKFNNEIDYLIALEKVANALPLSRPMKNYYISSGFGSRVDPITGRGAKHHGLDFVGMSQEKIISPSGGKIILAGRFSDYGNAVVIDHGFGITTRYGHLSEVKVKNGQNVKKGEVIALQGNSGRSTGQHLHYEVRYRNIPLDPKKFLEAGEQLFNTESNIKHANS